MEFLFDYGLFLAKTVTLVVSIIVVVAVVVGLSQRNRRPDKGHIEINSLNEALENLTRNIKHVVLNAHAFKQEAKAEKKRHKEEEKAQKKGGDENRKPRVYVVDFEGDIAASAVEGLREEITAILSVAEASANDEVVVRLESPGGMVHGYGLAASQLRRVTDKDIRLTVAVDKVAASGGYMMACIANHLIAAPFALLGSIGVVAQLPNFHRLLKNKDIDYEIYTAGEFKRTVTMFGENTDKGREKFREELEDVHQLFKDFISENRPVVNTDEVATGEAWYGRRALERKLVDALQTSDEYLLERCSEADVYRVRYVEDRSPVDRVVDRFTQLLLKLSGKDDLRHPGPYTF